MNFQQMELTDYAPFLGGSLKAEGTKRVSTNNEDWLDAAVSLLRSFAARTDAFTNGDFRNWAKGLPEPAHPNAWGALFNRAARRGIIRKTGRFLTNGVPSARARLVAEWRRV